MKYQSLHHISLSPDLICLGCGLGMETVSFTQLTARVVTIIAENKPSFIQRS